jgi:ribonuclease Z
MIPNEPPRRPQMGFLFFPPFRIQGISVAGEESCVHVPELDLAFDLGLTPRPMLPSKFVALTHGHMDHSAGLAYYFSQRHFQGMGVGTVVCHPALERPIHNIMRAWVDLEAQRTPYKVVPLQPDGEVEIKNHHFLRGFATVHTVPSLGFVLLERRSKLKEEYAGLPQEKLVELKKQGSEITRMLEIPLVCYTGDTMMGPHFDRPDVRGAKILVTECTFMEPGHKDRANVGRHLHLNDIIELLECCSAEAVVLTHLSRRTHMGLVRQQLEKQIPERHKHRVHLLMDSRTNRARYEQQRVEAGGSEPASEDEGGLEG